MKLLKYTRAILPLLLTVLVSACDSEGIDRNLGDVNNAAASAGNSRGSNVVVPTGPNRFVQLEKLSFEANEPSIISVMFQATDQYGGAIAGLRTSDFLLLEDNEPVSAAETSLSIVPHEQLPFSLRTVVMIDVSSSISPSDLNKIKAAVRDMITDTEGQSKLMAQQEMALYSFDDKVTLLKDYTGNAGNLVTTLDAIQPAVAITPTDFYGAVITGAGRIEDSFDLNQITQGTVIIITDGTDTAAKNTYADALASVTGKSVYTLGVGDEISSNVMQRIGTSGTFALRNFEQLNSVLQSINQQVVDSANSFYYLHYASPKRGADGAPSSMHNIRLSVQNNANRSGTATITDSFDATDFSNVEAEVVISGPKRLELLESAIYRAHTHWAPQPISNYLWSLPEDNTACQLEQLSQTSIRVTAVAAGQCTLTAEDQLAGSVQGWYSIEVETD